MRVAMRCAFKASVFASALTCLAVVASAAWAQPAEVVDDPAKAVSAAHRKAEHERIHSERAAITAKRQQDEAACYQRFSVENCLRDVRAKVRDAETRLRNQEIELNDAERKEKAAERLRSIEEKTKGVPAAPAQGGAPGASLRGAPAANPQSNKATMSQREHDAERRAQDQRNRVQTQATEQATRNTQNADRAAKARARQAEVIKAAEERRARVEKSQADAAAAGRTPAAPLPASTALPAASSSAR